MRSGLDEFVGITGYHRKHAMRLLRSRRLNRRCAPPPKRRIYDDAVRGALVVIWEASDRICGKRLKALVPILVEAMERHDDLVILIDAHPRHDWLMAAVEEFAMLQVEINEEKSRIVDLGRGGGKRL